MTRRAPLLLCLALLSAACGEPAGRVAPPDLPDQAADLSDMAVEDGSPDLPDQPFCPQIGLSSLTISPTPLTLSIGQSQRLTLTALDACGQPVDDIAQLATWQSADELVAVVDSPGDILALGAGQTVITAQHAGLTASASLTVAPTRLDRITLSPQTASLSVGGVVEFLPTLWDAQGRAQPASSYTLVWSAQPADVMQIDQTGRAQARSPGQASVTLTVGELSATAQLTVTEAPQAEIVAVRVAGLTEPTLLPGESLVLTAQAEDAGGQVVPGAALVWSSSAPAVASVDQAGRVTALTEGQARISATAAGGAQGSAALDVTFDADSLIAGGAHACALIDQRAFCWGDNTRGQLGHAQSGAARAIPTSRFQRLAAGAAHTCGVEDAGRRVVCWGAGERGQLGQGSAQDARDAQDTGLARVNALCAGERHTCAIGGEGQLYCWGDNVYGQLGQADGLLRTRPTQLNNAHQWVALSCGARHTCAVDASGQASCWGENARGQLGDQSAASRSALAPIAGAFQIAQLVSGALHTLALTANGTPLGWGANDAGQLGEATRIDRTAPTFLAAPLGVSFVGLACGQAHSCALAAGGQVYCWGAGGAGQLGGASAGDTPALATNAPAALAIAAGGDTTYLIDLSGDVWAFGAATQGQLVRVLAAP